MGFNGVTLHILNTATWWWLYNSLQLFLQVRDVMAGGTACKEELKSLPFGKRKCFDRTQSTLCEPHHFKGDQAVPIQDINSPYSIDSGAFHAQQYTDRLTRGSFLRLQTVWPEGIDTYLLNISNGSRVSGFDFLLSLFPLGKYLLSV